MASETARKKYPAQIVVMTTTKNRERFVAEAERDGVSIAEVVRGYLEAGISHLERLQGDAPEPRTDADLEREQQYRGLL